MSALFSAPLDGAYHLVTFLVGLLAPVFGPLATAATIVLFVAAVKLALHPLVRASTRGQKAQAELAPQVRAVREKHRKDPQRMQQEIATLYKDSGTSMFAGCLPALVQLPFFMIMFRLFASGTVAGRPNDLLTHTLFGAPLGHTWLATGLGNPVFLAVFALLAVVAWFSSAYQARTMATGTPMRGLLRLMPYGTLLAAAVLPLAAGLYLLVSTAWTTTERRLLMR
jgi:YidC/Oxa1 family membrane protein insertase